MASKRDGETVLTLEDMNKPAEDGCGQALIVGKRHFLFLMCQAYPLCQHVGGAL